MRLTRGSNRGIYREVMVISAPRQGSEVRMRNRLSDNCCDL